MIAIIDYGVGNLKNVRHVCKLLEIPAQVTRDPEFIRAADAIILPGVGAFRDAIKNLKKYDLIDLLKEEAQSGKPFLGICLGMQVLFEKSYEDGQWEGLGLIEGEVVRFEDVPKVPHMGWNTLTKMNESPITKNIEDDSYVYFVHSYHALCKNPQDVIFATEYGKMVPALVQKGNVLGMQFHPEKSADVGLQLLMNFKEMIG
ncbi:imidazole glycerol phosphate synthase subunit HisH [Gottschalkiaceae bacterium SANA]|nr:imidazole glycerol phosphate synthase subunit HisH [Gottschalkiaceae bacterium SANA]